MEWDPSAFDHDPQNDEAWGVELGEHVDSLISTGHFPEIGQHRRHNCSVCRPLCIPWQQHLQKYWE
jgi:hypothetical protein